jgi:hypothetical protein
LRDYRRPGSQELSTKEQRVTEELRVHQLSAHEPAPQPNTALLATKASLHLEPEIRRRAYELYEQSGHQDGHALDDRLRAEAEITTNDSKDPCSLIAWQISYVQRQMKQIHRTSDGA